MNPQFLQMVSPNETVVVISLNTTIGETSGMINICIPHVVLEPIIPKLSMHYWMQTEKKDREPIEVRKARTKYSPCRGSYNSGTWHIQYIHSRFFDA